MTKPLRGNERIQASKLRNEEEVLILLARQIANGEMTGFWVGSIPLSLPLRKAWERLRKQGRIRYNKSRLAWEINEEDSEVA